MAISLRVGPAEDLVALFGARRCRLRAVIVSHRPAPGSRQLCRTEALPVDVVGLEDVPGFGYRMHVTTCRTCGRSFRLERSTLIYEGAKLEGGGSFRRMLAQRKVAQTRRRRR